MQNITQKFIKKLKKDQTERIRGSISIVDGEPIVRGWLAEIGDINPRTACLRIDNQNFELLCDTFRPDLKENGINEGNHSFEFSVPIYFMDGEKHPIQFFDKLTGKLIAEDERILSPRRNFKDLSGFLSHSFVSPVLNAPFREEDKRCFATMENVANHLASISEEQDTLVSVIMPVYNCVNTVKSTIDSVLRQTYPNIELIIADDGSDDGSRELIEKIEDERIILLCNESSEGFPKARNRALGVAKGKYIAYIDSGNIWDSRYIAAMVGAFLNLPDADALYSGQFLFKDNQEHPFAVRFASLNKSLLYNNNYIDLSSFCHTHDLYHLLGGFDTSLQYYEGWDWIMRVAEESKMYSIPVLLSNCYHRLTNSPIAPDTNSVHCQEQVQEKRIKRTHNTYKTPNSPKMATNKVSIIIPSYESFEDICECINSLLKLQASDWLEIIVVDNASSQLVVDYLTNLEDDGKIKLIKNEINYGFTYAVNQGIGIAEPGSDVLLMNNDAIVTPGAIESLQEAAYQMPHCGMVVPQQVLPGGTRTMNTHVPYANPRYECDVNPSVHHGNIINAPLFQSGEILELNFAPFFCVYIKRDVLDNSVGLDAEYGRHYRSDRIFCNYVRHVMNLKIYHVAEAVVFHKLQKSTEVLEKSSQSSDFDMISRKNQWDEELKAQLDYHTAIWDF